MHIEDVKAICEFIEAYPAVPFRESIAPRL